MLGGSREMRQPGDRVPAECTGGAVSPSLDGFDRHVIGRIFLHAADEARRLGETVPDRLGVEGNSFHDVTRYLRLEGIVGEQADRKHQADDEELMVREILSRNQSPDSPIGDWLSCMLARRALEPNHLWEDLGLVARPDLSRLLSRHFAGLASKNTRNMRWKKFLYRAMCEAEGFTMCPSPTCDACSEFSTCYADESGASALARNSKNVAAGIC